MIMLMMIMLLLKIMLLMIMLMMIMLMVIMLMMMLMVRDDDGFTNALNNGARMVNQDCCSSLILQLCWEPPTMIILSNKRLSKKNQTRDLDQINETSK